MSPSLTEQLQARLNAVIMFPSGAMSMPHATPPADVSDDSSRSENGSVDARSIEKEIASTYRDFSHVLPEKHLQASSLIAQSITAKEATFPAKLHSILSNPEFEDIISWLPHGRSWRILQQEAFEERVIPLYFRHSRYSSFARQVNGWGFGRVTRGSDYKSYYHELFLRGMPHLCETMHRLTSKDRSKKKIQDESSAPDFYAISLENPLPENPPATRRNSNNQMVAPIFSQPSSIVAPASPVLLGGRSNLSSSADAERAVLLECFRSDIRTRMSSIVSNNNNSFHQNNNFQNNTPTTAGNLSASMFAMQNLGQMFNPTPTATDAALLEHQMIASLLAQTDISKLLSLAVAGNANNGCW